MIILGVIPARYESSRYPGKPLAVISGKTMIQRVYEQALKSHLLSDVIVATDDRRIIDCVRDFGGKAIMTSKNHKSGTERICEIIKHIKSDIVVNIQGDEPFIPPDNIDLAVKILLKDKTVNVSTLAVRFRTIKEAKERDKVKVVFDKNYNALYFSRSLIPYNFKNINGVDYFKHIGLYAYRTGFLKIYKTLKNIKLEETESLEQLKILGNGYNIRVAVTENDSVSVDTRADLKNVIRKYKLIKN